MNYWRCIDRDGYGDDPEYRNSLLKTLGIKDDDEDVDKLIIQRVDELYKDVGHHFVKCLESLSESPSRSQYFLLFGKSLTDSDLFVFLFSFDTFFHMSKCIDQIVATGTIKPDQLAPLLRICSK